MIRSVEVEAVHMISAYCLGYQHFTVIPHQMRENFADMAEMGFDAVCLSFSESEMTYSRRAFEIQVDLAKKAGLKVLAVPSRLGGRYAGAPLMPSIWLAFHPEYAVEIGWLPAACIEAKEFRAWIKEFLRQLLTGYDLDGIVWDEPKGVEAVDTHQETVARYGPNPTKEDMIHGFLEFQAELSAFCKSIKPDISQTLFVQKSDPEAFTIEAAKIPEIEYFGYDGNLARQSFFHEEPKWLKYRLESVWERTQSECRNGGKKTFALVENMLMPREAMPEFEINFEMYLRNYRPDHLSIYYYAHNNEDPEGVHGIVRRLMKQYLKDRAR